MILAKKITDFFSMKDPIAILAITCFLLGLLLFLVLIILSFRIIKLQKIITNIFANIHIINSSPSRLLLRNSIKALAIKPQFEKRVKVWNFWVYRTFNSVYANLVNQFCGHLNAKKSLFPSKNNIKNYINIKNKFKNLLSEISEINVEMQEFVKEEILLRNYIIYLKIFFDNLKDECFNFAVSQKEIKIRKMEYAIKKTQEKFGRYYVLMKNAKYSELEKLSIEISEYMTYIMDLLDKMPNLMSILNKVVPDAIQRLRKNHLIVGEKQDMQFAFEVISQLSFYAQEQSLLAMQMLSKLQFISAENIIKNIFHKIHDAQNTILNGEILRNYFNKNISIFENILEENRNISKHLEEEIEEIKNLCGSDFSMNAEFNKLKLKNRETEELGYRFYDTLKASVNSLSEKELVKVKNIGIELLEEIENNSYSITTLHRKCVREFNQQNGLLNEVLFLQELLTQYFSKIKNNAHLGANIEKFITPLITINEELSKYDTSFFEVTTQDKKDIEQENHNIEFIWDKLLKVMVEIDDLIFIDAICQKIIKNAEMNSSKKKISQQIIVTLEKLYQDKEYDGILKTWENLGTKKQEQEGDRKR